ncbi:hypothetical protein FOMPIDRAFT_16264, partial [Fomitopsis schrenkii]
QQELALREGQANDALHRIRMALGMKSVVLRTRLREAQGSQRKSTRAWKDVQGLGKVMAEQARIYTLARSAMKRLLMDDKAALSLPTLLQRFQPLDATDLEATTEAILLDHTQRGGRNKLLSWIWAVDVGGDTDNSEWLSELHRVNWLRQKARTDRWEEQYVIVQEEMKQTVRSFEWKASQWDRLLGHGGPGHESYARRQGAMWRGMAAEARAEF